MDTRNCKKVHKDGVTLGVQLSKFNDYNELTSELDRLFELNGELMAPNNDWLMVYKDTESRLIRVGEDPWLEFCWLAIEIFIAKEDEVMKMTRGRPLHSRNNPNNEEAVIEERFGATVPSNLNFISGEELRLRLKLKREKKMRTTSF